MNWEGYQSKVAAGITLIIIAYVYSKIRSFFNSTSEIVTITFPEHYIKKGLFPGLLVVHNGFNKKSDPINKRHYFTRINKDELQVRVKRAKNRGLTYKCFVDHKIPFQTTKDLLEVLGYLEITSGAGKANRAWFLIPGQPVDDDGRFRNNKNYPE